MAPTYWHGGPAGLPIGSTLLPRAHLEHLPARDAALGGLVLAVADRSGEHDPAHVYVTTDRALAGHFPPSICSMTLSPLKSSGITN